MKQPVDIVFLVGQHFSAITCDMIFILFAFPMRACSRYQWKYVFIEGHGRDGNQLLPIINGYVLDWTIARLSVDDYASRVRMNISKSIVRRSPPRCSHSFNI